MANATHAPTHIRPYSSSDPGDPAQPPLPPKVTRQRTFRGVWQCIDPSCCLRSLSRRDTRGRARGSAARVKRPEGGPDKGTGAWWEATRPGSSDVGGLHAPFAARLTLAAVDWVAAWRRGRRGRRLVETKRRRSERLQKTASAQHGQAREEVTDLDPWTGHSYEGDIPARSLRLEERPLRSIEVWASDGGALARRYRACPAAGSRPDVEHHRLSKTLTQS